MFHTGNDRCDKVSAAAMADAIGDLDSDRVDEAVGMLRQMRRVNPDVHNFKLTKHVQLADVARVLLAATDVIDGSAFLDESGARALVDGQLYRHQLGLKRLCAAPQAAD